MKVQREASVILQEGLADKGLLKTTFDVAHATADKRKIPRNDVHLLEWGSLGQSEFKESSRADSSRRGSTSFHMLP